MSNTTYRYEIGSYKISPELKDSLWKIPGLTGFGIRANASKSGTSKLVIVSERDLSKMEQVNILNEIEVRMEDVEFEVLSGPIILE